jgi:Ser/Thr protein kinase RdoA (MazF antagonist)
LEDQERATFDAGELAIALSYYDLGVIESITEFTRGSRRSPKVGVVCDHGKFVLKRRSMIGGPGRSAIHPDRVRFTHRVQKCLAGNDFPMAKLIPTSDGRYTFVQVRDYLYELFEFVAGHPYQQTASEAGDAGVVLARFHHATEGFSAPPALPAPRGDYHDAPGVRTGLCSIGSTLSSHESFSGDEAELAGLIQFLLEAYDDAAEAVNQAGFAAWPSRIIHSDWHPGNLLFRKLKVVAVIDYDSVRQSRRGSDVANGALQFSMVAKGDPASWPDHLDEERWHAFVDGYESRFPITDAERGCIPHLMAEALIAECVPPITHTGSVGRWAGFRVLQMVRRKVKWLTLHGERITRVLKG